MNKYLLIIPTLIVSFMVANEQSDGIIENPQIEEITNKEDILFYKGLLKNYFNNLPNKLVIYFTCNNTKDSTEQNAGTICIDKFLKILEISSDTFYIYNKEDKFFLKDKELDETNLIKKPEIVDLFFNNNLDSILKNAKLFKKNNRLSCKIEIADSIGSSTIILSFNILDTPDKIRLELKFWNIKNEYMKNTVIKIIKIKEKI